MSIDPLVENAVNRVRKELIIRTDSISAAIANNTSGVSDLDLIAGENLTVGDPVSLGIDGKAYKSIGLLNNPNVPTPLPLATSTRYLLDTVASKIIALGVSSLDNDKLYTAVGMVSASGALTWGVVTTHTMADAIGQAGVVWDAVRQSNNQLFLAYNRGGTLRTRIVEYSGITTTVGTEVSTTATNTTSGGHLINLVADSTGRVLVAWFRNSSTFTLWGARATVSGTTITLGTETQITLSVAPSTTTDQRLEMLYDATQDRAVILAIYQYSGPQHQTDLVLVNFSSTVSTVATSALGNHSPSGTLRGALSRVSGTSSYLVRRCLDNTTTRARIFTVSTTAFTLGTEVTLSQNANAIDNANWVEDTVNNKIIFGYDSNGCQVFTRSGTTLTLQTTNTDIDFTSSTMNFFNPYVVGSFNSLQQIYDFSGTVPKAVGTLNIYTTALTSQARLLTATSGISYAISREASTKLGSSMNRFFIAGKLSNENQIGVSTQTVSAAATAKVRLKSIKTSSAKSITGLSGLTPGAHYYLDSSGARALAGISYLGYAKSATELILANPSGAEV